jgi:hypothetical protein
VAIAGMLQDAAVGAYSGQRSLEASAVIALDLADAGLLDEQRLAGPKLPPALAGRVSDDGVRASVAPRVTLFRPWINARHVHVAAVLRDVQGGDHGVFPCGRVTARAFAAASSAVSP